ncbi:glycosyltransferase family 39 protein [Rhizobium pusense]|uniref:ArnT family glycosyltransferase n=1 Tax=Agrobacterium pusense TaxID=648995 RepID=UPI002447C23D|nr:glycosyltransferase family 39 protein [Agrobacterium pusense]MDH1271677.1 glycosyltransferase family 39 protein [Agrobacterium pusense]
MIEFLERHPARIFGLLAAYFLLQIAVRLALPASLELDEAQQIFLSQWFSAGYDSQPPFYNWLQYAIISVFGVSVASLTIPKNIILFLSYGLFGLTAFSLIRDRRLAAIAILGLLTIPQISFEAQRDLTHTVAAIFAACFFLFSFLRTLTHPSVGSYLLAGVAIGVGLLSKYNFVLLPVSLFFAVLWEGSYRSRVFDWRILLAGFVAFITVVYPHGLWFLDHLDEATASTISKMAEEAPREKIAQIIQGILSIIMAGFSFSVVTVIIFTAAFGSDFFRAMKSGNQWTRLFERAWCVAALLLLIIVLFFGAVEIRARWLTPLLLTLPLYLCLKLEAAETSLEKPFRRFARIILAVMAVIPVTLAGRILFSGWIGSYEKLNVPYGPMVEQLIGNASDHPAAIIAGDVQLAGNIRLHVPNIPVMAPKYPDFLPNIPAGQSILLIWRERRSGTPVPEIPKDLAHYADKNTPSRTTIGETRFSSLPYHYGTAGDSYTFSYAWVGEPSGLEPAYP